MEHECIAEPAFTYTNDFYCRLIPVFQSHLELLAEEEMLMPLYDLVWKLNDMISKAQFDKLTKVRSILKISKTFHYYYLV